MNKKQYIVPEVEIAEMEAMTVLAASVGFGEEDEKADAGDSWTNRRRGQWGNLWVDND